MVCVLRHAVRTRFASSIPVLSFEVVDPLPCRLINTSCTNAILVDHFSCLQYTTLPIDCTRSTNSLYFKVCKCQNTICFGFEISIWVHVTLLIHKFILGLDFLDELILRHCLKNACDGQIIWCGIYVGLLNQAMGMWKKKIKDTLAHEKKAMVCVRLCENSHDKKNIFFLWILSKLSIQNFFFAWNWTEPSAPGVNWDNYGTL